MQRANITAAPPDDIRFGGRLLTMIATCLRRFRRDDSGLAVAEMVLVLPIYLFTMVGLYTYWDGFHVVNTAQKASYAVSDLITRESNPVSEAYVTGLVTTMRYMMGPNLPTNMRVTSVFYVENRDEYRVIWSRSSDMTRKPRLTTALLRPMIVNLPELTDGEAIILLETWTDFKPKIGQAPLFGMLVGDHVFENFVVTRPRFVPKVCLTTVACG